MKKALCLAGGGIKGAAHIGVLKAFEEANLKFDCISGTSSGSIVATLNAVGYNADEIYELFKKYCKRIHYIDFEVIIDVFKRLITKDVSLLDIKEIDYLYKMGYEQAKIFIKNQKIM